jgi:hypothetical protein
MGPLFDSSDRFMSVTDWFLQAGRSTPMPEVTPTP